VSAGSIPSAILKNRSAVPGGGFAPMSGSARTSALRTLPAPPIPVLRFGPGVEAAIRRHGEQSYPEEACGFLVGPSISMGGAPRDVSGTLPAVNEARVGRDHRFIIGSVLLRDTERSLERSRRSVVGFYHTHPDGAARPSRFDLLHAWPRYAYLVLEVLHGRAGALAAFELDPKRRRFDPVGWMNDGPSPRCAPGGNVRRGPAP
jgi:proteasome lid subunit RPN8/RPN11